MSLSVPGIFMHCFALHLMEHLPSECPQHPGVGGLRGEVEEMGEEPRSRGGIQVCRAPQGATRNSCWIRCPLGSPPTLIISNSRDCQEPTKLCLWATTSIIPPFRCLEWWSRCQLIGYSIVTIIKILNLFPNQYMYLPMLCHYHILYYFFSSSKSTHITKVESRLKRWMSPAPYNTPSKWTVWWVKVPHQPHILNLHLRSTSVISQIFTEMVEGQFKSAF